MLQTIRLVALNHALKLKHPGTLAVLGIFSESGLWEGGLRAAWRQEVVLKEGIELRGGLGNEGRLRVEQVGGGHPWLLSMGQ